MGITTIWTGQNGRVWITGTNPDIAIKAIRKIEEMAHTSGLTEYISKFLAKEMGAKQAVGKKPVVAGAQVVAEPKPIASQVPPQLQKKTVEELEKKKAETPKEGK